MKKRQRKKRARVENDWYKNKELSEWDCPTCSWCALDDEEWKHHKVLHTSYGYADYYGYKEWDLEVKCPCCGTKFVYCDSNM